jgi:hypothetical protein
LFCCKTTEIFNQPLRRIHCIPPEDLIRHLPAA